MAVIQQHESSPATAARSPVMSTLLILVATSFIMRALYGSFGALLPEEAYYWQFSRHLDWSYLDHPPMVAWLIWLGTTVFGQNEFGVRFGSWLCAGVTAFILWKFSVKLFSRTEARESLLLFAWLPYFFLNGFLVTPDAPLLVFWAASLWFAWLALVEQRSSAWFGLGASFGLGMLSKYTIALNGAAVLLFMLFWPPARRWFFSPIPYLAAILCALIASPVLYWNASHDWISFTFQTSRRLEEATEFSLHVLIGGILCLLTPAIAAALVPALRARPASDESHAKLLFLRVFALFPIVVFALFSLRHEPKINWTGPAFLVALPFIAHVLVSPAVDPWSRFAAGWRRPTLVTLAIIYLVVLGYLCIGIPGLPFSPQLKRYVGWQDLGKKVGAIAAEIEKTSGSPPLIVGMDKHFIGSELAFYTTAPDGSRPLPPERFAGRALFDMDSLMWMFWSKSARLSDTLILVARGESDLNKPELYRYLEQLGPIERIETVTRGSVSGVYFYRIARHYRRPLPAAP